MKERDMTSPEIAVANKSKDVDNKVRNAAKKLQKLQDDGQSNY